MNKLWGLMGIVCIAVMLVTVQGAVCEDIPNMLNFQGRVAVGGQPFNGTGQFKFALVDSTGNTTYWSNDNSSVNGSEPASGVAVFVRDGIYNVLLGGGAMQPIPESVFENRSDVFLRVWFNDNTHGFEHLEPDQRIVSVAYSYRAAVADTVKDSGRTIITGQLDSRDPGDETVDVSIDIDINYSVYPPIYRNIYVQYGIKSIPVADLDPNDMPIVNVYWNNGVNTSWYPDRSSLVSIEGENHFHSNFQYPEFRVIDNYVQLFYPHLTDRDSLESNPFLSYVSNFGSYTVFYKIVIMR